MTYICQLLTDLYHTSTIPILGKLLCQSAVYGNLVNSDFVIIRFLLSQRWQKCFYPNETPLIPTKSYLHIPNSFKSCKNICILPTQSSQFLLFKLIPLPPPFPTGFLLLARKISTRILFHRQSVLSGFVPHLKAGCNRISLRILFSQVFAPFFIVKWFRYNQRTWAESHLTFYMFFPSFCYQFYILILPCLVCIVNQRPALDAWKLLGFLKNTIITFPTPELQCILVRTDFWVDIKLSVQYVIHLMELISEI